MTPEIRAWIRHELAGAALMVLLSILLGVTVNAVRPDRIPWMEDWEARLAERTLPEGIASISFEEAVRLHEEGVALFVDARDPGSYEEGHIPGALNLPLDAFDDRFPELEERLMQAAMIVTYCNDVACDMGEELAVKLQLNGFANIGVYIGGIEDWKKQGRPVETGPPEAY